MNLLYNILFTSIILGGIILALSRVKIKYFAEFVSIVGGGLIFVYTILLFLQQEVYSLYFHFDHLAKFISLSIAFFGIVILVYSLTSIRYFIKDEVAVNKYYGYVLLTIGTSISTVYADNFVLFLVFWSITGLILYLMINLTSQGSTAAKKTFIIIGAVDCLMILGFDILFYFLGQMNISNIKIDLTLASASNKILVVSFICLLLGALAKAGAVPLHSWIPDMAEVTAIPTVAFLPASLDKLLGIYFLVRICVDMFNLSYKLSNFVMLIGVLTIIIAVFMAMVQHQYRKLLAYHAVSQVGYMVLGIGTGNPVGIAGGLFHMLNNAIYKSCLFLTSGTVEQDSNTSELDSLGGYAKLMPMIFFSFLISALSISGVPPFNGFVSKWMIYQALLEKFAHHKSVLPIIFLIFSVFGSALTLASFVKLTYAIFLARPTGQQKELRILRQSWTQNIPTLVLATICIIFGVFAVELPLKYFILPSLPGNPLVVKNMIGMWQPQLATLLIIIGIILGIIFYVITNIKVRKTSVYLLGELDPQQSKISGTDFYNSIKELAGFKLTYFLAGKKLFDIYEWGKSIVLGIGSVLSFFHNGNLHFYLSWVIIGLVILLLKG